MKRSRAPHSEILNFSKILGKRRDSALRKIDKLRKEITELDNQLLDLLNRRAGLSIQIGKEKAVKGDPVYVPHREREILDDLKRINGGPFPNEAVEILFREIFSASRALQEPTRVSFLGPKATFSHQVAVRHFGHSSIFDPASNIESVFSAVEKGSCDFGVVPVENSIEGTVNLTLDCFVDSPLYICGEMNFKVAHFLMSKQDNNKDIKKIYSHPQPLAQCRNWLNRNFPRAEQLPSSSTASAAEAICNKQNSAAIASKLAAEIYGLNILAENIQDRLENFTRFLIIGKKPAQRAEKNKTSILFSITDEAGSLLKMLQLFARKGINLTRIQSRPLRNRPWEYLFYIDIEGHEEDETVSKTIKTLEKRCLFLRNLGSYPQKG